MEKFSNRKVLQIFISFIILAVIVFYQSNVFARHAFTDVEGCFDSCQDAADRLYPGMGATRWSGRCYFSESNPYDSKTFTFTHKLTTSGGAPCSAQDCLEHEIYDEARQSCRPVFSQCDQDPDLPGAFSEGYYASCELRDIEPINACQNNNPEAPELEVGNPINCATGAKLQREVLYEGQGSDPLFLSFVYTSINAQRELQPEWRSNWDIQLIDNTTFKTYFIEFPNGNRTAFPKHLVLSSTGGDTNAIRSYTPELGIFNFLQRVFTDDSGTQYQFNAQGQLIQRTLRNGWTTKIARHTSGVLAGKIETITNHVGQQLQFAYNTQHELEKITLPNDVKISISWHPNQQLASFTFPDGSGKQFVYENTENAGLLTGIIDGNGNRYATWSYDSTGRAITSEHGQGKDKVEVTHSSTTTKQIRYALNESESRIITYTLGHAGGHYKVVKMLESPCEDCEPNTIDYHYDRETGNLIYFKTANDVVTYFEYDEKNRLKKRVAAQGTTEEQVTDYQWHPTWPLIVKITTPYLLTENIYRDDGHLKQRIETDRQTNQARITTYHYENQTLKSIDGPRLDVDDSTEFTYTTEGFLKTITNPLGHITEVLTHTTDGKIETLKDPNGILTQLTYTSKNEIASINYNGRKTLYGYDKASLLRTITLPDGEVLTFDYDEGHRLTALENTHDERLEYTLDNAGNIQATEIRDPMNALVYSQQQVFNGLGQLKQQLGNHGQITQFRHNSQGLLKETQDGLNYSTIREYDALDRLQKIIDPLQGTTLLGYDQESRLSSIQDAENRTTYYQYNGFGEIVEIRSPDTGVTVFSYDSSGNLRLKLMQEVSP